MPTAAHVLLHSREEALEQLAGASYPTVLKADGLAAGKGVILCAERGRGAGGDRRLLHRAALRRRRRWCWRSSSRARSSRCWRSATARTWCRWRRPRTTSGSSTATRGRTPAAWAATRRCRASAPAEVEEIVDTVHRPIVAAMARRGRPFHGVLYAGLMIGADGPKVLEFNTRFGDPETQAVLPRLRSDLVDLFLAAREPGGLAGAEAEFGDDWAVTLVLASAGYPESSSKGDVIRGLAEAAELAEITHAGTAERDGEIVTAGGRVLNVTGARADAGRGARSRVRCGRAGSPSTECRSAPTSPPAPSSASPANPVTREEEMSEISEEPSQTGRPRAAAPDDDAGGRGGLRGNRRRRAAGRDHHGLEERQAEDAAGRRGAATTPGSATRCG